MCLGLGTLLLVFLGGCAASRPGTEASTTGPAWSDGERVRQLYHVQVAMADRKSAASKTVDDVHRWWQRVPEAQRPPGWHDRSDVPVSIAWQTPYYRVRIGPFLSRQRARQLLDVAADHFPNAMIALEPISAR